MQDSRWRRETATGEGDGTVGRETAGRETAGRETAAESARCRPESTAVEMWSCEPLPYAGITQTESSESGSKGRRQDAPSQPLSQHP